MKNIAVGEGSQYGCGSPLVHAQLLSMSHDLLLPALIRSQSESSKMTTEGKKVIAHPYVWLLALQRQWDRWRRAGNKDQTQFQVLELKIKNSEGFL